MVLPDSMFDCSSNEPADVLVVQEVGTVDLHKGAMVAHIARKIRVPRCTTSCIPDISKAPCTACPWLLQSEQ